MYYDSTQKPPSTEQTDSVAEKKKAPPTAAAEQTGERRQVDEGSEKAAESRPVTEKSGMYVCL